MCARVGKSVVDFMMLKDGKWEDGGEGGVRGTHDDPETRWPAVSGGGEWKGRTLAIKSPIHSTNLYARHDRAQPDRHPSTNH
jgi:hypothetical protein